MAEAPIAPSSQRVGHGQVREALDRLEGLVVDGLKHGFFGGARGRRKPRPFTIAAHDAWRTSGRCFASRPARAVSRSRDPE
jgi:hypothetical protein